MPTGPEINADQCRSIPQLKSLLKERLDVLKSGQLDPVKYAAYAKSLWGIIYYLAVLHLSRVVGTPADGMVFTPAQRDEPADAAWDTAKYFVTEACVVMWARFGLNPVAAVLKVATFRLWNAKKWYKRLAKGEEPFETEGDRTELDEMRGDRKVLSGDKAAMKTYREKLQIQEANELAATIVKEAPEHVRRDLLAIANDKGDKKHSARERKRKERALATVKKKLRPRL